jgi:hypothetical protein
MNASTTLIVIVLSNQGYWFGGEPGRIDVQWAMQTPPTAAVLEWNLLANGVRLAGDRLGMPTNDRPSTIEITSPAVRVRTAFTWQYRLLSRADGRELERGERIIHSYPTNLLDSAGKLIGKQTLLVLDSHGELGALLDGAHVPHHRIKAVRELQLGSADAILVGSDELAANPFEQSTIVELARAGKAVCLLGQAKVESLAGYALASRAVPTKFEWRLDHPLLAGFSNEDAQSWFAGRREARAIRLPVDEPVLEIGWWPREDGGTEPVPIDAVLAVKAIGKGRIVCCELPLNAFKTDPRSQQLLANVLGYLATRPEPTLPPSRRQPVPPPATAPVPTITIPPGGIP